jgi:hypothetical protein
VKLEKRECFVIEMLLQGYMNIDQVVRWLMINWPQVGFTEFLVENCLRGLAARGLVAVYWYDVNQTTYVATRFDDAHGVEDLWFGETEAGARALDENWDPRWTQERHRDRSPDRMSE